MESFKVGSRVHTGFGDYVDTRWTGTVIDQPGTIRTLVFWDNLDGTPGPTLSNIASLRPAETPCAACGGLRQHQADCAVLQLARKGHSYTPGGIRPRFTRCRICDRDPSHSNHSGSEEHNQ